MPELPEVETMCRGIACFRGEVIATTQFPRLTQRPSPINPPPKNMAAKLHHARILDITRLVNGLFSGYEKTKTTWIRSWF